MAFGNHFRYIIYILILISTIGIFIGRINLSVAIVYMAENIQQQKSKNNLTELNDLCPRQEEFVVVKISNSTIIPYSSLVNLTNYDNLPLLNSTFSGKYFILKIKFTFF